jgi:purine-binding chemotaxis protein CheW
MEPAQTKRHLAKIDPTLTTLTQSSDHTLKIVSLKYYNLKLEITMQAQPSEGPAQAMIAGSLPVQVVTFKVDDRLFGVDVAIVREIKGWQQATPLPNAASHVLGVINLRGLIVAVYDLRRLLGIADSETSVGKVVMVVDVGERQCGIVADAVSDILGVSAGEVRPSPTASHPGDLVTRLVVKGETVIALINVGAITQDDSFAESLHIMN